MEELIPVLISGKIQHFHFGRMGRKAKGTRWSERRQGAELRMWCLLSRLSTLPLLSSRSDSTEMNPTSLALHLSAEQGCNLFLSSCPLSLSHTCQILLYTRDIPFS